jgi:hypothetical protein
LPQKLAPERFFYIIATCKECHIPHILYTRVVPGTSLALFPLPFAKSRESSHSKNFRRSFGKLSVT